jgi:hypothetical protein
MLCLVLLSLFKTVARCWIVIAATAVAVCAHAALQIQHACTHTQLLYIMVVRHQNAVARYSMQSAAFSASLPLQQPATAAAHSVAVSRCRR